MNTIDYRYQALLQDILDNGVEKSDRTGTGTLSVFGRQIRHKMSDGFPLLTTKKMAWKTMVVELLWFLKGDTNIKYLVDNDCHIWDGDAYKRYVNSDEVRWPKSKEDFIEHIKNDKEWEEKWGELGPIYGKQWRSWKKSDSFIVEDDVWKNNEGWCSLKDFNKDELYIDQIANLINDLKTNPDSRRLMVNAWNVGELDQMVLPPCHYGFQVYTRELSLEERHKLALPIWKEKYGPLADMMVPTNIDNTPYKIPTRAISLMWNQRSVDTFLGLPFNIASYGLLLTMIADEVNMVPDELIGNLGDVHLYSNHIEQAKEQIGREMTTEERNEWHFINRCGGNKRDCKTDWKDFELDQQDVPKRTREPYPLPTVHVRDGIFCSSVNDVILENYQSHPTIKAPLSN